MMKDANIEEASDVYTDPALSVTYSESTGGEQLMVDSLRRWVEKQGRLWPAALGPSALARNMRCVHVPCLLAEATVAFGWSAEVAYERTRRKKCRRCSGSGSTTRTETYYEPETYYTSENSSKTRERVKYRTVTVACPSCGGSGRVAETYEVRQPKSGTVDDYAVTKHEVDPTHGGLKCGFPDLATATKNAKRLTRDSGVRVFAPARRSSEEVGRRVEELVWEDTHDAAVAQAATDGGRVVSVNKSQVAYRSRRQGIHLYPVWVGHYTYGGRTREVEVDGHTGLVYVEPPAVVRVMRFAKRAATVAAVCVAALGGVSAVLWLLVGGGFWAEVTGGRGRAAPETGRSESGAVAGESTNARDGRGDGVMEGGGGESDGREPAEGGDEDGEDAVVDRTRVADAEEIGDERAEGAVAATAPPAAPNPPRTRPTVAPEPEAAPSPPRPRPAAAPARPAPSRDTPSATTGQSPAGTAIASAAESADAARPDPPVAVEPVRVGGNVPPPRKTWNVTPEYPRLARLRRIQGIVILEVTVDRQGEVSSVSVLRSAEGLDDAAVEAVRQWRYEPTMVNGRPVSVIFTETVRFQM